MGPRSRIDSDSHRDWVGGEGAFFMGDHADRASLCIDAFEANARFVNAQELESQGNRYRFDTVIRPVAK